MKATIWHNPRCSKSRETLALLQAAGAEIEVVEYLSAPPSREAIAEMVAKAGLSPRDALRADARAGLKDADDAVILDAMAADSAIIERPFVATAKGARLGRPPERVREIL